MSKYPAEEHQARVWKRGIKYQQEQRKYNKVDAQQLKAIWLENHNQLWYKTKIKQKNLKLIQNMHSNKEVQFSWL